MVRSLGAGGRVAAVALLAVSSVVPHSGPVRTTAAATPVADVVTSCSVTVGTATTDAALATDAARALTAGYALTDCMPDASLLDAAEARAAIPLPGSADEGGTVVGGAVVGGAVVGGAVVGGAVVGGAVVGGAVVGTSSGTAGQGTATAASGTATAAQGTATAAAVPTTSAAPTTSAPPSTATTTATTAGSTRTTTTSSSETLPADGGTGGSSSGSGNGSVGDSDGDSDQGGTTTGPTTDGTAADGTTTAAERFGWGQATRSEDFDGDLSAWGVYDGPGHAGKGRRSPTAMSVANGVFTISGDAAGTTGGMAWRGGEKYGRWEARVRSPAGDPTYNAVMLLWPDAENWPVGGEVDFMEIGDESRQKTDFFLHYGEDDHQLHGQVAIDATQWHNWAVEWAPDHITAYVDGQEWYTTTRTEALPPGPMHLTLQLDWFPKGGGAVQPSTMSADWVRYYPITGTGAAGAITNSADGGAAAATFVGPLVADTGRSGAGSTGDTGGAASVDDSDTTDPDTDSDDRSVAGVTATSTTTVTRTATAQASATATTGSAGSVTTPTPGTTTEDDGSDG